MEFRFVFLFVYFLYYILISEKDALPTIPTQQGQPVSKHEPHQGMVILLHFITIFMHCGHKS